MAALRDPYDGEPFYCVTCSAGYGEYAACEDVACQLESKAAAEARKAKRRPIGSDLQRALQTQREKER